MFELYQTPVDILYLVLTVSIAVVSLLLAIVLFRLSGLIKNFKSITEKVNDTTELINHYLWMPIKVLLAVVEKGKNVAEKKRKAKK